MKINAAQRLLSEYNPKPIKPVEMQKSAEPVEPVKPSTPTTPVKPSAPIVPPKPKDPIKPEDAWYDEGKEDDVEDSEEDGDEEKDSIEAANRLTVTASIEDVSYKQYCAFLSATLKEADELNAFSLPSVLTHFFSEYKKLIADISEHLKVSKTEIVAAFKERSVFKLLKALKFSVITAVKAVKATAALLHHGLMAVVHDLEKSGAFQHVQKSAKAVDDLLAKYPLLKKLAGPALAGLLIWMWFNMSFSGNFDSDMALDAVIDALKGNFSIYDLFATPSGIAGLVLLAAGLSGVSLFNYLSVSNWNFLIALFYTAAKKLHLAVKIPALSALKV